MSQASYQIALRPTQPLHEAELARTITSRILIVDDDALPRELISSYLESANFKVLAAVSGEDAVRQLTLNDIDLVLTDMSMPGMNGMDVLKWVRENRPSVPVIMITGMCELKTAVEIAEGIQSRVRRQRFPGPAGELDQSISLSIGVMQKRAEDQIASEADLFKVLLGVLHRAEAEGGDRILTL